MKLIRILLLVVFCFTCFAVPSFAIEKGQIDYKSLSGELISDKIAKLILEDAKKGNKDALNFLAGLDVFDNSKANDALLSMKGKDGKYVFPDGSYIEVGTTISTVESAEPKAVTSSSNTSITATSTHDHQAQCEKYLGVGIGNVNFGAYFIYCQYWVNTDNTVDYIYSRDRQQSVPPLTITCRGTSPAAYHGNFLDIYGSFDWNISGGGGSTWGALLVCFPNPNNNYIGRTY